MISDVPIPRIPAAAGLNRDSVCTSVDPERLAGVLAAGGIDYTALRETHPQLFSETLVFADAGCVAAMAALIGAVETVVALPAYQEAALARAPAAARQDAVTRGAFLGFDFHVDANGPKLIEINTNPGGVLLNTVLLEGQRAGGYDAVAGDSPASRGRVAVQAVLDVFLEEWRLARGDQPLRSVAVVDEAPADQYLAPEFELFRRLFEWAGLYAVVANPAELLWDGSTLRHRGERIDLVYNRLTDFALEQPGQAALAAAWQADAAVLTPHPRAHALYADKRNLVWLCDDERLTDWGVPVAQREVLLSAIPTTLEVGEADGEHFWATRKQWFFKPAAGFGSRAAYRGDKLTRRVFDEILRGGYVAQKLVPPPERRVAGPEGDGLLKYDLRCYAYAGHILLIAARLYQGQTTNFRTPGGGFAPVMVLE